MKCPICKQTVQLSDPAMPFCSERCRLIDLGVWADEGYRIPGPPAAPDGLTAGGDASDDE